MSWIELLNLIGSWAQVIVFFGVMLTAIAMDLT